MNALSAQLLQRTLQPGSTHITTRSNMYVMSTSTCEIDFKAAVTIKAVAFNF
jgi:hypothetical protein